MAFTVCDEGARILDKGIAARASDIDLAWINGYGWTAWTGGPMFWAERVGIDRIVAGLEAQAADDPELAAPRSLRDVATRGFWIAKRARTRCLIRR